MPSTTPTEIPASRSSQSCVLAGTAAGVEKAPGQADLVSEPGEGRLRLPMSRGAAGRAASVPLWVRLLGHESLPPHNRGPGPVSRAPAVRSPEPGRARSGTLSAQRVAGPGGAGVQLGFTGVQLGEEPQVSTHLPLDHLDVVGRPRPLRPWLCCRDPSHGREGGRAGMTPAVAAVRPCASSTGLGQLGNAASRPAGRRVRAEGPSRSAWQDCAMLAGRPFLVCAGGPLS